MSIEIIDKYLSINKHFIKKIERSFPLKDKNTLYDILKWWMIVSKLDRIGSSKLNGNTPIMYIKLGSSLYYINADTSKEGVKTFLKNKTNSPEWRLITNNEGKVNKVTNDPNQQPIKGLYMYKDLS